MRSLYVSAFVHLCQAKRVVKKSINCNSLRNNTNVFFQPIKMRIPRLHIFFLPVFLFLFPWASWTAFQNAGIWLSNSDSPKKAEVIVCLGGPDRVRKAAELVHRGYGRSLILTAVKTKDSLVKLDVPQDTITLAPWPKTTFQEALAVAPLLKEKRIRSALVVTDPFHIKRVHWTFEHVFKDQPVRFEFISSDLPFVRSRWWEDKTSRFYVLSEYTKMVYYRVFHGMLGVEVDRKSVV